MCPKTNIRNVNMLQHKVWARIPVFFCLSLSLAKTVRIIVVLAGIEPRSCWLSMVHSYTQPQLTFPFYLIQCFTSAKKFYSQMLYLLIWIVILLLSFCQAHIFEHAYCVFCSDAILQLYPSIFRSALLTSPQCIARVSREIWISCCHMLNSSWIYKL